ncbi:MAG: hypothetical protein L0J18_13405, partial [Tetragenococcus koreensis]|nr:hypothetical protein [Tetragenococcus koreensis]
MDENIINGHLARLQQVMSQELFKFTMDDKNLLTETSRFQPWQEKFMRFVRRIGAELVAYMQHGEVDPLLTPTHDALVDQLLEQCVSPLFYERVGRQGFSGRAAFLQMQMLTTDTSLSASMKLFESLHDMEWDMTEPFESFRNRFNDLMKDLETFNYDINSVCGSLFLRAAAKNVPNLTNQLSNFPIDVSWLTVESGLVATLKKMDVNLNGKVTTAASNASAFAAVSSNSKLSCYRCGQGHLFWKCEAPADKVLSSWWDGTWRNGTRYAPKSMKKGSNGNGGDNKPNTITQGEGWTIEQVHQARAPVSCPPNVSAEAWAVSNEPVIATPNAWIADSGATVHITNKQENFSAYAATHGSVAGLSGSNQVVGIGTIPLVITDPKSGHLKNVLLKNVLHIPSCEKNIISTGLICDAGNQVGQDSKSIFLLGSNFILGLRATNRLYLANAQVDNKLALACRFSENQTLWHNRLCHLGETGMKALASVLGIQVFKPKHLCTSCLNGKATKVS